MKKIIIVLLLVNTAFTIAEAQSPEWYFIRPDKTGIGGDYLQVVKGDCNGNIWTAGYMPFWSNGSVVRFNYADTIFTCWGNYDGYLPADRVYDIAFDNNDGVWVATNGVGTGMSHGGIAHYDGTIWTQYTTLNTPMPADDMRGITVDGNNNVWATFYDVNTSAVGGIAKFNGTTWTIYTPSNSNLQTAQVDKIKADAQNNIWIGTNMGLVKFDGLNWILNLTGSSVSDVEYDASANKIYAVTDEAINIYDGTSWSQINSTNAPVSATGLWAVDARGDSIIITTIGGTYLTYIYDGTNWITHPETNHTYDARIDLQGNFWICGIGFLEKFDGANWTRYTRYNTGLVDYVNNQVFVDSKNRKWFGSSDGGIQIFDCPHWEIYGPYNEGLFPSLQNMTPTGTSITEDSYGDIWMTYDGVLGYAIQVPGGDYKNYSSWVLWETANVGAEFQMPLETEADDSGHVFMRLYSNNVQMYDHSNNSWTNYNSTNSGLPPTSLLCMTPRAEGKMYFGGFMFIYILDNGAWSTIDFAALGLPIMFVYDIAFDHNNFMWLATDHGVYKYDGTTWTNWTEANSNIAADHVTSIDFGNADTVFIGAHNTQTFPYYGGISIYDGTSWTSFLQDSSPIAHKQVEDIEMDTLGNLWIITQSEGITVYKNGGVIGFDCIDLSLQTCATTGVIENNLSSNLSITVFPNPFTNTTTIEFNLSETKNVSISIYDMIGKEVKHITTKNLQLGNNKIISDLSTLDSGIYFCKIKSNESFQTVKLIKN
jgi:ligand-binding sensor domain-containing protein